MRFQSWRWSLVAAVVSCILISAVGALYTRNRTEHAIDTAVRRSEQKLCKVIIISDELQKSSPEPTGNDSRSVAIRQYRVEIHTLREQLHCN
jgi:hypothetical protein